MANINDPKKNLLKAGAYSFMNFMPEQMIFDKAEGGIIRFRAMFEMPDWSGVEEGEMTYIVDKPNERLDNLAVKFWGVDRQEMYWIIAARNNLDLPDVQLTRGRKLKIPSKGWIDTKFMPQAEGYIAR